MKINGVNPLGKGGESNKKSEPRATGPSFGDVLKETLNADNAAKTRSAPGPLPLMPPAPLSQASSEATVNQATNMVESALGDLEMYQNALANPKIPNDRLKPMAQNLMDSKDKLVAFLPKVGDGPLKGVITQTASLIISESSRLNSSVP
ncbi:MAG: hypothetical protein HY098_07970 [Nitrospinae bacterium]|nr:hypothetical protein [Nitrospinota bacterium]